MLMSQIVGGKKYQTREYAGAISVSFGMSLFLWGNHEAKVSAGVAHQGNQASYNLMDGLIILAIYLTFDSFTSNWQKKLFDKYKISRYQMMAVVNCYSILLTCTSLAGQGSLLPSLKLVLSSGLLTFDCIILSIFSAVGQFFIYSTIERFGALALTIIMTLRQVLAILLSCLIYSHPLHPIAFLGVLLVFSTLFSLFYCQYRNKNARK